jgi:hypothetical protein
VIGGCRVGVALALVVVSVVTVGAKDSPYPHWATPRKVDALLANDDSTVLLGGGIGLASWRDDSLRRRFLERAHSLDPRAAAVALSMADVMIALSSLPGPAGSRRLETVASVLRSSAPDNAAGDFVLAFVAMARGDAEGALRHLRDGNARGAFETYSRERFRAIVAASEALGADPREAREYAFGTLVPTHVLNALMRTCRWLRDGPSADAARSECLEAGRLADRDAHTLLESLLAANVQHEAVRCTCPDTCAGHQSRRRVAERRRILAKLLRSIAAPPKQSTPSVDFYDAVLVRGEEAVAVDRVCAKRASARLCAAFAGA